jgi:hypothetical protein
MKCYPTSAAMTVLLATALLLGLPHLAGANDPNRTVTIWIHGFDHAGVDRHGAYGDDFLLDAVVDSVASLGGLPVLTAANAAAPPADVVAATTYYGDTPPAYFTATDVADVDRVTTQWGGGIPRYALVVAKYARHLLERSGAQQVNFVSGSFGSLVVRWLIEKDVEGLASEQKIARWLSAEGLLCGNWAANRDETISLLDALGPSSIDLSHMTYGWIDANLHAPRTEADNPFYSGILLGAFGSTDDSDLSAALSVAMSTFGEFAPNDGVQALPDAYFRTVSSRSRLLGLPPTLSLFHISHLGLGDHRAAWAHAGSFITQRRRVRVTMTSAQVTDLHEVQLPLWDWRPAEVVFESRAYSPAAEARWGITDPLSTCEKEGGAAPLRRYQNNGETQSFSQSVFDGLVSGDETELRLVLHAHEIDYDWRYGVFETTGGAYDDLGGGSISVSATSSGTYSFSADDWSCVLQVDVVDYPFGQLLSVPMPRRIEDRMSLTVSPNPSYSSVLIAAPTFAAAGARDPATLWIYDLSGRLVRRMTGPSEAAFVWPGLDREGRRVPPGVYAYRWASKDRTLFGRSLLLR